MLEWAPRAFIKSALIWLGLGATLGVGMAIRPEWIAYRPAHVHMNLLGFVAGIIFGVGYQILPRFMGQKLHSTRLATVHWWLANLGLAGMVAGFGGRVWAVAWWEPVLQTGAAMSAIGTYCFVYNLFRSFRIPSSRKAPVIGARPLPVAETGH